MVDVNKLDELHYHEFIDRLHLAQRFIQTTLLEHAVINSGDHEPWERIIIAAQELLATARQIAGEYETPNNKIPIILDKKTPIIYETK